MTSELCGGFVGMETYLKYQKKHDLCVQLCLPEKLKTTLDDECICSKKRTWVNKQGEK